MPVKSPADTCKLLTSAEIQSVQGEAVRETKGSERSSGPFLISQCFYTTPTFSRSVSIEVTQRDPAHPGAETLKELWREKFQRAAGRDEKREREKGEERGRDQDQARDKEEESRPPERVGGVGEEAYWVGNRLAGALYVLKGDRLLRISIGGSDDQPVKIRKTKILARQALKHL